MKKYFCYIFVILCFCSCKISCFLTDYPTSKNFNKSKHLESVFYLCYIDSEPEMKNLSEIDTIIIDCLNYRLEKKVISNFEMIVFNIKTVEVFMWEKVFKITQYIHNDIGNDMPNREFYLTKYNKVYLFIDRNNKADIASKKMLLKSYKNKKLVIVGRSYYVEPQGISKPMISTQVYKLDNRTRFDNLIRIE